MFIKRGDGKILSVVEADKDLKNQTQKVLDKEQSLATDKEDKKEK